MLDFSPCTHCPLWPCLCALDGSHYKWNGDGGVYLSFVMVACPFSTVKLGLFIDFKLSFFFILHSSYNTQAANTCTFTQSTAAGSRDTRRLVAEGLVVEVEFTVTRSNTLQVGDVSGELLDGLHLLAKEVGLNEVGHL